MIKEKTFGVVIGRFQTPYLTKGHRYLIDSIYDKHNSIIIFVGVSVGQPTKRNPLNFDTRKLMLHDAYPNAIILPIKDNISDSVWSKKIDESIISLTNDAILYGCRDSFISYYDGNFKTIEISTSHDDNATEIRRKTSENCNCSEQFRAGIIYAISNRFPSPYITVDVAMIKDDKILFGKKLNEPFYRFIGGFVDASDTSISFAAKRELHEETGGVEADNFELIGEAKINHDWRYKKDEEKIFTALFKCKYIFGNPTPTDDINSLTWIPIDKLNETEFMPEHKQLVKILINNLNQK